MLTSLWVAYPLYSSATEAGDYSSSSWKYYTEDETYNETGFGIPVDYQVNVVDHSYGVNVGSTDHEGYDDGLNKYARGHQVPNADRKNFKSFNRQTYYVINSTPQIQNGFNSGVWNTLEGEIRKAIPANDTVYVATGPAFQKGSEPQDIVWITPQDDNKPCPVPNYYWKVLLKVKRDGSGNVTSASSVGFWFEHRVYSDDPYSNYAVSVDQIEQWTGFDFFTNLPDSVESSAETNSSWSTFTGF